mgnify:CR=1 FL=1
MDILTAYRWPGNVRELRNVVQRGVAFRSGDLITPEEIKKYISGSHARGKCEEHMAEMEEQEKFDLLFSDYLDMCIREYFERMIERYGRKTAILAEKCGKSQRHVQNILKKFNL